MSTFSNLSKFSVWSKMYIFVQIVQFCPNCQTLSKLSNVVQIVQFCLIFKSLEKLARAYRLKFSILFRTMACSLKPSRVAPVGDAFAQYKKNYGEEEWMKLFMKAEDDHHSSVKGSYLAACVHYSMIFGEPCSGNSFRKSWTSQKNGKKYKLSDESAEKLQKTADEIVGTKDQRMNFVFHSSNDSCEISPCLRAG